VMAIPVAGAMRSRLRNFSFWSRALRTFSFPVSALPVLVATAAVRPVARWRWDILLLSVLGAMLLHGAGNVLNDYFDFKSGVDRRLDGDEMRPGRLVVRGELSPRHLLFLAAACLLPLLPISAYLLWKCGPWLLAFGLPALFALYCYTGPPFELKYHAAGEPTIFLIFGPVLFLGSAFAQTGSWEWLALLLSVPVGFVTTAILVGGNIRDEEEDRFAAIVTLTHLLGGRGARLLYVLLIVGSAAALAFLGASGLGPRALLAAPILLLLVKRLLLSIYRLRRLPDIDQQTARFASAVLVFLLLATIRFGG